MCIFDTMKKIFLNFSDFSECPFSICEELFIRLNSVKNKHGEENTERCFCVSIVTLFFLINDATL